ncbi:unnamed protein product, partial [Cyprideis torosa]
MYDLGQVGTGSLAKDLNRTWAKLRGKPDPYATIAELNDRTKKSDSGSVWALKDIDFEVERGEVLGIIGRNGAVAAFLEPEILIVDEVLAVGDAEFQKRAIGKMQD